MLVFAMKIVKIYHLYYILPNPVKISIFYKHNEKVRILLYTIVVQKRVIKSMTFSVSFYNKRYQFYYTLEVLRTSSWLSYNRRLDTKTPVSVEKWKQKIITLLYTVIVKFCNKLNGNQPILIHLFAVIIQGK